jgi:predicted nucleic acid-binding protein
LILGDSSAWIDALRRRRTRAASRLDDLVGGADLVTTDAVAMEVLAGARDEQHRRQLDRIFATYPRIPTEPADFDEAAAIFRTCRRGGHTPRSMIDCLIAAVAMRVGAAVLHNDRDFDLIARHVPLAIDR